MSKKSMNQAELLPKIKEAFSKYPVSIRKASKSISTLLLYTTQNTLPPDQFKNLYFHILRGLNTDDHFLKSLLYSTIMQLNIHTKDSFLAINSLTKDLNSDTNHLIKGKALLTLFLLVPKTMIHDFEKYVTQAFVSKFEQRKSAASIVGLMNLENKEIVRKWVMNLDLIQNVPLKDYHALALLSNIRDDKTLLSYLNYGFKGTALLSVVTILFTHFKGEIEKHTKLVLKLLKTPDEMVIIETARQISKLDDPLPFLDHLVTSLKPLLKSTKKVVKFASIRIIAELSLKFAPQLSKVNKEIEDLVGNSNRAISMMAVTTLLKTGTEETVDRLLVVIPEIMGEMSDGMRIVVISALESLAMKFVAKEDVFVDFMRKSLNEKGSVKFKRYIIQVMQRICSSTMANNIGLENNSNFGSNNNTGANNNNTYIRNNNSYSKSNNSSSKSNEVSKVKSELTDKILDILAVYIEDSQNNILTMDILGLMGTTVGKTKNYKKYIIHILNRLIIENAHVRCSALQALFLISLDEPRIESRVRRVLCKYLTDDDEFVSEQCQFLLHKFNVVGEQHSKFRSKQYDDDSNSGRFTDDPNVRNYNDDFFNSGKYNDDHQLQNYYNDSFNSGKYHNIDTTQTLKTDDLGNLKDRVISLLGDDSPFISVTEKKDTLIKKSREIQLNNKNDDFGIYLSKRVYPDCVILRFRIVNLLEGIKFRAGKVNFILRHVLGAKCGVESGDFRVDSFDGEVVVEKRVLISQSFATTNNIDIKKNNCGKKIEENNIGTIENNIGKNENNNIKKPENNNIKKPEENIIKPEMTTIHENNNNGSTIDGVENLNNKLYEISLNSTLVINAKFTYEITEEDFDETEIESISMHPFDISWFDFITPFFVNKKMLKNERKIQIRVEGDLFEVKNKIKNIFNMKVLYEENVDGFKVGLGGKLGDKGIVVECECSLKGMCEVRMWGDDLEILDLIADKICE